MVIHGIPDRKIKLRQGDIVSVDVGAFFEGYHGDNARTFPCGDISEKAQKLLKATEESLYRGIAMAKAGNRIGDIRERGAAVCRSARLLGGTGFCRPRSRREAARRAQRTQLRHTGKRCAPVTGMTIAIEPMVNAGSYKVKVLPDGWTTVTTDGELSAHFEHTVAITRRPGHHDGAGLKRAAAGKGAGNGILQAGRLSGRKQDVTKDVSSSCSVPSTPMRRSATASTGPSSGRSGRNTSTFQQRIPSCRRRRLRRTAARHALSAFCGQGEPMEKGFQCQNRT